MGTRNITRVRSNGEVKINQYCQWDGYPTGRGLDVLKFCRDLAKDGRVSELKDYLETTSLINANKADYNNHTYTGAPYFSKTGEVFDFVYDYGRMHPEYYGCALIDKMLDEGFVYNISDLKGWFARSKMFAWFFRNILKAPPFLAIRSKMFVVAKNSLALAGEFF